MQDTFGLPDRNAALKQFRRASATFDDADFMHAEARSRLLSRLPLLKLDPRMILDLGAATGKASGELAAMYPGARILAMDNCRQMVERSQARCAHLENAAAIAGDAERLPLQDACVDLVFANLLLPWCDPREVFSEAARVLREGGLLLFTSVGPDTLREVRWAWSEVDDAVHVHGFTDMHDLGDIAAQAGLAEPVLDVDRLNVSYRDVDGLVSDLRACGATNVAHGRRTQLTGRSRWRAFRERLVAQSNAGEGTADGAGRDASHGGGDNGRRGGKFSVSVELIFGQAWGAGGVAHRRTGPAGDTAEVGVSVEELRRELRGR